MAAVVIEGQPCPVALLQSSLDLPYRSSLEPEFE